jgi:hypothetical protein
VLLTTGAIDLEPPRCLPCYAENGTTIMSCADCGAWPRQDATLAPRLDPCPLERLQRRIQVVLCDNCYDRRQHPREYDPDFDNF